MARKFAEAKNLEFDERRWQVIGFVHGYFEERQTVPEARTLLKATREALGKEKVTRKYLYELFPSAAASRPARL